MTPVPLDLPVRPAEAAELGNLIFDHAERKALTDDIRNRIAARAAVLRLETITPHFGSLARDPVHPAAYYLAVDAVKGEPLLLYIALATAPTSSVFQKPLLIGRMRRAGGPEMVINAIPFGPSDEANIERFASGIDRAFLPRPQGARPSIAVDSHLPGAFDAFRALWKRTGKNLAAIALPSGSAARPSYYAAVWSAIRAGWREGYSAGIAALDRESVREAAACTTFTADLSAPAESAVPAAPGLDLAGRFEIGETVYELSAADVACLSAAFAPSLERAGQLYEAIRQTRSSAKAGRSFDFEISLENAASVTTPEELIFCLHWLKTRGHGANLAAPRLSLETIPAAAAIARHFGCLLSVRTAEFLDEVSRAAAGRVRYTFSGAPDASAVSAAAEILLG